MLKKTLNTDPTFGNRLLIFLWFLFVPLAVARSATVLDNTFDPATTSGLRVLLRDLSPSSWYATPITTDGFEYKLNSIKTDIEDFGPPVGLFLEIWDVSTLTGGPSSSLGRLQLVDPGFPKEFEANILSGEISLSANTSYYVVTGVDNGGGSYREQINFADPPGPYFNVESGTWLLETVLPGLTNQMSFRSTTLGRGWQESGRLAAPLRMTIDATSVCPEIVLSNTAGAVYNLNNADATIKSLAGGGTSGGNVLLGSGTLSIGCQNGGAEFAGSISGTGRIIKIGSGTQTFTGANTYTGGTEIRLGVLAVSAIADSGASGLGNSGTLLLSGGTLSYTGTTNATTGRLVDIALSATNSAINISSASGHLTLTGNSIAQKPRIDAGYLSDAGGFDMKVMLAAVKLSRQLLAQPVFDAYRGPEVFPGEAVQSDAELENFIREKAESIYHPVGTCKMGAVDDADAVVDSQCRVKGVRGLRVVDASVMPKLIGGNTNAPTIMLAERVADIIRAG